MRLLKGSINIEDIHNMTKRELHERINARIRSLEADEKKRKKASSSNGFSKKYRG